VQADRGKPIRRPSTRIRRGVSGATQRRALFWVAFLAVFGLLLWLLSPILLPFVLGMAVGYFLDPFVNRLERMGVSRAVAAGALLVVFFAIVTLVIVLVAPIVVEQATALAQRLPDLAGWVRDSVLPTIDRLARRLGLRTPLAQPSMEIVQRFAGVLSGFAGGLLSGGLALVNVIALLAITPVVAFYLLRDWPKIIADVDGWLPREYRDTIHEQARRIDAVLAGFARGAALSCLALAAFYAIALSIAGLDFGVLIGIVAGLLSFVPYVGTIVGFTSSVGVALFQFWPDWVWVAVVAAIFVVGQVLQDYVLAPRLIGPQVGLHPLWLIFAVLAGGALFGFLGVLLAVPACAVIGVLVRFAIARYKESPLYRGDE
jgi:predicted PurR-regulated permease PerM